MKKLMTLFLVLAALLMLTACGKKNEDTKQTDAEQTEQTEQEEKAAERTEDGRIVVSGLAEEKVDVAKLGETAEPAELQPGVSAAAEVEYPVNAVYSAILNEYHEALSDGRNVEAMRQANLNEMIGASEGRLSMDEVGYLVRDFDGDGTPELYIGAITDNAFFHAMALDLYTINADGEAQLVLRSRERDRYYYAGDALFANHGSNGAADSIETTLNYAAGILTDLKQVTPESSFVVLEGLSPLSGEN